MQYKPLGNTGKKISAVSFGAMRFLPEEYKKDHQICADILLRAAELGINYFDTAPGYCEDHSEDIVGLAMRQLKNKPYVSTKCGLWNATTADEAYTQVNKSLERLCVDKINIYNMWCIKNLDEYNRMTAPGGMYEGILRAKEEGLVEHICCTTHADSAAMEKIAADGLVESVTLGYNAINFAYRRQGVKACHAAGMGVVIMNPLGGGTIPRHADLFSFLKSTPDESIVHAALRFLIGQPEVTAALPGPANITELEECVAAAEREYLVTDTRLEEIAGHLKNELNTLCTTCSYCDECPVDIPVPELMDVYNEILLSDTLQGAKDRLQHFWDIDPAIAKGCIRCGHCETLCTQKLPIIERLDEIAKIEM